MPCDCIQTAVIVEDENEKLRTRIKILEKKIKKYQYELLLIYDNNKKFDHRRTYKKSYISR